MKKSLLTLALVGLIGGLSACSKKTDTTAVNTDLTISGQLSQALMMMTQNQTYAPNSARAPHYLAAGVTVSDLEVYGIAFTNPPAIASVTLGSDGSFSLTLPGAKGAYISLIFRDKNDKSTVGTVEFVDTTQNDLDGNDKSSTAIAFNDNVSLGNITMAADGTVSIPVSTIATAVATSTPATGTAFDMTGSWTMAAYEGTLPTGYETTITLEQAMAPGGGDKGMVAGMPITFVRLAGKAFTPGAGCTQGNGGCTSSEGTIGTEDRFGISVWGGATAPVTLNPITFGSGIAGCGWKLGFYADDARYNGVHLESAPTIGGQTVAFGDYGWTAPAAGTLDPLGEPWTLKDAYTQNTWMLQKCFPKEKTGSDGKTYRLHACEVQFDTESNGSYETTVYSAGLGGGCYDEATNKPVMVTNWQGGGAVQPNGACATPVDTAVAGIKTQTCRYTGDPDGAGTTYSGSMNITCSHSHGYFTTANLDVSANPSGPQQYVSVGGLPTDGKYFCKDITHDLTQYRCYAEYFYQHGGGDGPESWGTCSKEYRFNWGALTAGEFVMTDGRNRPSAAFMTEIMTYTPDGQTALVENSESEVRTIHSEGTDAFCKIEKKMKIALTKVSDTQIRMDMQEDKILKSIDNALCVAAAKAGQLKDEIKAQKTLLYLNKI